MSEQETDKQLEKQLVKNNRVIVTVIGGVAHLISKPKGITVEIRDYDGDDADIQSENYGKQDEEGEWHKQMLWEFDEEINE